MCIVPSEMHVVFPVLTPFSPWPGEDKPLNIFLLSTDFHPCEPPQRLSLKLFTVYPKCTCMYMYNVLCMAKPLLVVVSSKIIVMTINLIVMELCGYG